MSLVEKWQHPKWTGGFVASRWCRCGHAESEHIPARRVEQGCWAMRSRATSVAYLSEEVRCSCPGFKEKE